jgi:hypothetical protein
LFDADVGVDGGVASGAGQVFVVFVGDVCVVFRVFVAFREAEVDRVDLGRLRPQPQKEVVGLDVAMDEQPSVDVLQQRDLAKTSASTS